MQGAAGRAQPGPGEAAGGKVWALPDGVAKMLPLLEQEPGGFQGCVISARPIFPTGSWWVPLTVPPRPCPHNQSLCWQPQDKVSSLQGLRGQTQLVGAGSFQNLGNPLEEEFNIPNAKLCLR